jgi:hypothetical protein
LRLVGYLKRNEETTFGHLGSDVFYYVSIGTLLGLFGWCCGPDLTWSFQQGQF